MRKQFFDCSVAMTVLCLFFTFTGSLSFGKNVYRYEPTVTTLKGVLRTRAHTGPPNYESVKTGDTEEVAWLLKLPSAITVLEDGKDPTSINETEKGVGEVQLVIGEEKVFKALKPFMGKEIACTGVLFHRHTGHHHATILMDLKSYKLPKQ